VIMFASCCVCLVLVLSGFASGLLAHCVCTHVFAAVLEFAFAFCCCGALLPCLCLLWCVVFVLVFVVYSLVW
jgi:hypothetical protein